MQLKSFIKEITPPAAIKAFRYVKPFTPNFKKWWSSFSQSGKVDPELKRMVDQFVASPSFSSSSKMWNHLNRMNIEQLVQDGFGNFRQTVARNYFTFAGGVDSQLCKNISQNLADLKIDVPLSWIGKKHDLFTMEQSVAYNITVALLLDYIVRTEKDAISYLKRLEEPLIGNIPFLEYEGIRVSQDVLNGLIEFLSLSRACDLTKIKTVVEVGAGFGRTGYCLMTLMPHLKYTIADIPPALFVSKNYLTKALPKADVNFIFPHQLNELKDKSADLFLAIDYLHEMKREQVHQYFDHAERLGNNFYFKCWEKTVVAFDNVPHDEKDYPVRPTWEKIFRRPCVIPAAYFEAFYKVK